MDKPMEPLDGAERILVATLLVKTAADHKRLAAQITADPQRMPRYEVHARNLFELADMYTEIARKIEVR